MSTNVETLENIKKVMGEIGLADGLMMVDVVAAGPHSLECQVMLGDFADGLRALRTTGVICSVLEAGLLAEAEETITFFYDKYCS